MSRPGSSPRVLVVGGGIGGLCAAIALAKAGIEATVYERAEMLGDVGAGLALWANAIRVLRRLGLADQVIEAGSAILHGQVRTSDGSVLARSEPGELEASVGEPSIAIHRAALHRILLGALPEGSVRLGVSFTGASEDTSGVTARFSDGSEARGDLLVGADGVRSAVRSRLFPEAVPRYSGYTAWRGAVATRDEAALGLTSESWGRGNRFGIVRLDAERVYWFATANSEPGRTLTPAGRKSVLLDLFGRWHHPIRHLIESTPEEVILHNDIHDLAPMKRWSRGRITLLGDAAHATTPNLGQGACMAIESAAVLADSLSRFEDIPAAFADYEERRRPRTAWITTQSRQIGRVAQWQNPLACALRNLAVRTVSGPAMKSQLAKVIAGGPF